ncbi:MAG: divalent-cation tolerance protein CutA [Methanoregulaceae archaeon]
MRMMPGAIVILSTAPAPLAETIAQKLVTRRLAACVNMTEVRSVYRWEGEICDEPEMLLIIKTTTENEKTVLAAIRELHTYAVPEMIVLPITGGYPPYLAWIGQETGSG